MIFRKKKYTAVVHVLNRWNSNSEYFYTTVHIEIVFLLSSTCHALKVYPRLMFKTLAMWPGSFWTWSTRSFSWKVPWKCPAGMTAQKSPLLSSLAPTHRGEPGWAASLEERLAACQGGSSALLVTWLSSATKMPSFN